MGNFRRNKPRRQVVCTMCTPHRWMGNASGRFKEKEEAERDRTDPHSTATATKTRSPKRNWSRNKNIRSLRDRLKHLRSKRDEYAKRPAKPWWGLNWLLDYYDREIRNREQELAKLGG